MMRTLALLLLLASCATPGAAPGTPPGPLGAAQGEWRQQTHMIPMRQADGSAALLLARVCRPKTDAPARVVVIAHGSPADPRARVRTQLTPCDSEAARWFLDRGDLVVFSIRRGYGGTGGAYAETNQGCTPGSYVHAALESARDVQATVAYALALPYARPDGAIVVGQSAGGWAADGLDSVPHPGVVALVSMAGGRGGHVDDVPNRNCRPENLVAAAGHLGRTATTPMLWIYAANDSFFAPSLARRMHDAFTAAGGKAEFQQPPAFGRDGHRLFFGRGGSRVWGPLMERYLASRGI